MTRIDDTLGAMIATLKEEIAEVKGEPTIYKAPLGNEGLVAAPKPSVDVPKPKKFKGIRSTRDVENFLWGIESIDVRHGKTEIRTWEEFQKEFKVKFYLEYVEDEARAKLHRLR
ncbi:hypothetical protein PVK06_047186 [Gossypium arboreum]|uniref:Uncharacterized protein n=1 Tax=Gossypium arboreum TaxID=29729 RepID=A0ABR0MEJ2_GOSAR|nr:hypothetical protein PVK06_047186 [Gossypium arboreum]